MSTNIFTFTLLSISLVLPISESGKAVFELTQFRNISLEHPTFNRHNITKLRTSICISYGKVSKLRDWRQKQDICKMGSADTYSVPSTFNKTDSDSAKTTSTAINLEQTGLKYNIRDFEIQHPENHGIEVWIEIDTWNNAALNEDGQVLLHDFFYAAFEAPTDVMPGEQPKHIQLYGHREEHSAKSWLQFSYQLNCGHFYYGCSCEKFCAPNEFYTCESHSGEKLCNRDSYGTNCEVHCRPNTKRNTICNDKGEKVCRKGFAKKSHTGPNLICAKKQ